MTWDSPTLLTLFGSIGLLLLGLRVNSARRAREALILPANRLEMKHPKWREILPEGLRLKTETPLFDVLYEELRLKPSSFRTGASIEVLPSPLTLTTTPSPSANERASADAAQINSLIGMRTYDPNQDIVSLDTVIRNLVNNLVSVLHGRKKLKTGMEHVVLDSLGAGGGFAGAKLGGLLGLALTPFWSSLSARALSVIVPVFVIFGAWLGSIAGKNLADRMKSRQVYACRKKLLSSAKEFKSCFFERFPKLMGRIDQEFEERIRFARKLRKSHRNLFMRLFLPDLLCVFFDMSIQRLSVDLNQEKRQWRQIKRRTRWMNPVEFISIIHTLTEGRLLDDPELQGRFGAFQAALCELEEARKQAA